MNEPHYGYIGLDSLNEFDQNTNLHLGDMPNALESFALASGIPQVCLNGKSTNLLTHQIEHSVLRQELALA